jgi:hypothetical protein
MPIDTKHEQCTVATCNVRIRHLQVMALLVEPLECVAINTQTRETEAASLATPQVRIAPHAYPKYYEYFERCNDVADA